MAHTDPLSHFVTEAPIPFTGGRTEALQAQIGASIHSDFANWRNVMHVLDRKGSFVAPTGIGASSHRFDDIEKRMKTLGHPMYNGNKAGLPVTLAGWREYHDKVVNWPGNVAWAPHISPTKSEVTEPNEKGIEAHLRHYTTFCKNINKSPLSPDAHILYLSKLTDSGFADVSKALSSSIPNIKDATSSKNFVVQAKEKHIFEAELAAHLSMMTAKSPSVVAETVQKPKEPAKFEESPSVKPTKTQPPVAFQKDLVEQHVTGNPTIIAFAKSVSMPTAYTSKLDQVAAYLVSSGITSPGKRAAMIEDILKGSYRAASRDAISDARHVPVAPASPADWNMLRDVTVHSLKSDPSGVDELVDPVLKKLTPDIRKDCDTTHLASTILCATVGRNTSAGQEKAVQATWHKQKQAQKLGEALASFRASNPEEMETISDKIVQKVCSRLGKD